MACCALENEAPSSASAAEAASSLRIVHVTCTAPLSLIGTLPSVKGNDSITIHVIPDALEHLSVSDAPAIGNIVANRDLVLTSP